MKIKMTICGVAELDSQKGKPWTHAISIWDKRHEANQRCRETLRSVAPHAKLIFSFFDDVTDRSKPDSPTLDDIKTILSFTQELPENARLLIHCQAGVSRSPAIAYAVVCQHGIAGQELEGLNHIKSIRPYIVPNGLIIEWADRLLARKGELLRHFG
jgi:predicted protein tyrosine phosphatase